jgi:hypothetical protein
MLTKAQVTDARPQGFRQNTRLRLPILEERFENKFLET